MTIARSEQARLAAAMGALRGWLKLEHEGRLFRANRRWIWTGVLLSFAMPVLVSLQGPVWVAVLPLTLWLSLFGVGVVALVEAALSFWKGVRVLRGGPRYVAAAAGLFLLVFAFPFIGAELTGLFLLNASGGTATLALLLALVPLNVCFVRIMKAPSRGGRRLLDRIEGFKRYLTVAEADRVGGLREPVRTPEHFELMLPYAVALGVENAWAGQFAFELNTASIATGSPLRDRSHSSRPQPQSGAPSFASALGSSMAAVLGEHRNDDGRRAG